MATIVGTTDLCKHIEQHHKATWDNLIALQCDQDLAANTSRNPCYLYRSQASSTGSTVLLLPSLLSSSAPSLFHQLYIMDFMDNKQHYIPSQTPRGWTLTWPSHWWCSRCSTAWLSPPPLDNWCLSSSMPPHKRLSVLDLAEHNGKDTVAVLSLGHTTHALCMAHVINLVVTCFVKTCWFEWCAGQILESLCSF